MSRLPAPSTIISTLALLISLGGAGYSATGGNFILGQLNGATSQTRLAASIDAAALRIDNASSDAGAAGLRIITDETRPPLQVNSTAKVGNLNADKLDGLSSNQLVRVGRGANPQFGSGATLTDAASITLQIPQAGFVLVTGNVTGNTGSATCNPCFLHALLKDKTTNDVSPVMIASLGDGTSDNDERVLAATWVFPVAAAGARTFALQTGPGQDGSAVSADNAAITALYVPFGPNGTLVLNGGQPQTVMAKSIRLGPQQIDGRRAILR